MSTNIAMDEEKTTSQLDAESAPLMFDSGEVDSVSTLHANALKDTRKAMFHLRLLGLFNSCTVIMRSFVFVLYARSFETETQALTSISLYLDWILVGVIGIVAGYTADKWRFDNILVLCLIIDLITCIFESISWNFTVLAVAWVISGQPVTPITVAYMKKMLPIHYSQIEVGIYYQWYVIGYILGPCIAGIIAYYLSYRYVFIFAACLSGVAVMYCVSRVGNKETDLRNKQLALKPYYNELIELNRNSGIIAGGGSDESGVISGGSSNENASDSDESNSKFNWVTFVNYRFPIILDAIKSEMDTVNGGSGYKSSELTSGDHEVSGAQWFLTLNTIFQSGLLMANETLIVTLLVFYLNRQYNWSVIMSTGLGSLLCLFIIIGMQVMLFINETYVQAQPIGNNNNNNNNYRNHTQQRTGYRLIITMIVTNLFAMLCLFILFPMIGSNEVLDDSVTSLLLWLMCPLYALCLGMSTMNINLIRSEVQPTHLARKVAGIRFFIECLVRAFSLLICGFAMHYHTIQWFWYLQGCNVLLATVALIFLPFVSRKLQIPPMFRGPMLVVTPSHVYVNRY